MRGRRWIPIRPVSISATIRAPVILDAVVVVATGEAVRTDYERRSPLDRRFEAFIAPIARPGQDESPRGTPAVSSFCAISPGSSSSSGCGSISWRMPAMSFGRRSPRCSASSRPAGPGAQ